MPRHALVLALISGLLIAVAARALRHESSPVASLPSAARGRFDDAAPADGVTYFYQLRLTTADGRVIFSNVARAATPARALPAIRKPILCIDKSDYVLEACDGDTVVKRYPIALGRNPFRRKLHHDNASTPEGTCRIVGLQPDATFYKAYDIDYPNVDDRARYEAARAAGTLPSPTPDMAPDKHSCDKGQDPAPATYLIGKSRMAS